MDFSDMMRDAEIRALDLLARDLPDVLQRLVNVAAMVTGTPGAEIHVITSESQHTLAGTSGIPDPCSNEMSYCAKIVRESDRDHVVPDVRLDERFKDSPFTTSGAVVTYAATQLVTTKGVPIGTLCVFDPEGNDIDEAQMRVLAELSDAAMDVLEARRRHSDLVESVTELAEGSRELRRSNEHLAAFAGQVSHDIQGPLAAVLMALQLMEEEREGEVVGDLLLRSALSGAHRMRATITGLMDFAVLGGALRPQRLDMAEVVHDVLDDLAARRGRTQVVLGSLPKVWGDDVQVRAVTQNLVANALKYAGGGDRPVIRISGYAVGGRTRVSISDNGPGVPVEQRESIFDLMVRGEGVEQTGIEGLGIGLDTCRRIVEAHHGEIGVRTSVEGGAEFWFDLPLPDTAVAVPSHGQDPVAV
jgi:signal transduction histidine kinase